MEKAARRVIAVCAGGLACVLACSREPCVPTAPVPPAASASADRASTPRSELDGFSAAVREFEALVRLLEHTAPLDDGVGLRRAIEHLASAIEAVPGRARAARSEAVSLMDSRDFDVWISVIREDGRAEKIRETLQIAAGALTLTAAGPYVSSRSVAAATSDFRDAVDVIDGLRTVREERGRILAAMRGAATALLAIEVAQAASSDAGAGEGA